MRERHSTNLDDIRRLVRLGMGPCQGGFCMYRATGILHGVEQLDGEQAAAVAAATSCRSAGRACTRSSTATSCARRGSTTGSSRACSTSSTCRGRSRHEPSRRDRDRRGPGGADRGGAAGRGRRARAACWPRASASTQLAGGDDRRARLQRRTRVESPREALARSSPSARPSVRARGRRRRRGRAGLVQGAIAAARSAYVGSLDENLLLPTAVGVPKPTALVPPSMAAGDLRRDEPILVVGFRALKDFHPALPPRARRTASASRRAHRARPPARGPRRRRTRWCFARAFDDPSFRANA